MNTRPATRPGGRWTTGARRGLARLQRHKRATAVIAVALSVTVIAGLFAWQPARAPRTGSAPSPSATPSGSPASPSSSPAIAPEPDTRTAVARLVASEDAAGAVPLDATFRLTSLDGTAPADLAARLSVAPELVFDTVEDEDRSTIRLVPRSPLMPGAVYRFTLAGRAGQLQDSWAFQARQGVRVVGTLPEDKAVDVPLDTGIEVTFDQDGVVDAEDHITISPAVDGRFEQHGRVVAFVPRELAPETVYTVTVSAGVTVAATGETSTEAMSFRFETASTRRIVGRLEFQDDLIESSVADRPTAGFWEVPYDERWVTPERVGVQVFRLPSIGAATAAFQSIHGWDWTRAARDGQVQTGDLQRVLKAEVPIETNAGGLWLALPKSLPAGWYVVQVDGHARPIQSILQVSNVSAYLAISSTKTVVWANDIAADRPIADAAVRSGGTLLGRTGSNGLLLASTPAELLRYEAHTCSTDCPPVLTVTTGDGRAAILPAITPTGPSFHNDSWQAAPSLRYWSVFNTDRSRFRPTDTINAWGLLRDRDTADVPGSVVVRLVTGAEASGSSPVVGSIDLEPGPTGAFAGSIPIRSLPLGYYTLELVAGGEVVDSRPIEVGQILKPAYRVELATGHRVYIAGDRIRVDGHVSFYDGTPVPGLPLRLSEYVEQDVTTDAAGGVVVRTTARVASDNSGYPEYQAIYATPRGPEEGEIVGGSADFVVFPSSRLIDATAEIDDGRVQVSGAVHLVDQERLNREIGLDGSIWDLNPNGAAVDGARVSVQFIEHVPVRGEGRQVYDFLEKRVVTVYEYTVSEHDAGTVEARTGANGTFSVSIPADGEDHNYEVRLSTTDADGHVARQSVGVSAKGWQEGDREGAVLGPTDPTDDFRRPYGIGESIDLTLVAPTSRAEVRSFLFVDAQRGIRSAVVQASPRFVAPFTAASAPETTVVGVRFNGAGYDVAQPHVASFRQDDRALQVELSTAPGRHKPGDRVTVDALVRNAAGNPVAAAVVVRVIDEKLFTVGDAIEVDALAELYRSVGSGIRSTYATHRPPVGGEGYGDTGGGDDRSDFRDALLFSMIETGPDGRGSFSVQLSDDLTSWRVIGSAITRNLEAGSGSVDVPVGLPFFVEATIAPEYLVADRPSIVVRTFGEALESGERVSITVDSESLDLHTGPQASTAFSPLRVPLPALSLGRHEITIRATTGSGTAALSDGVKRTIVVVESRLSRPTSRYAEVTSSIHPDGGPGLTTVVVSDAGSGRTMPLLVDLAGGDGARLDRSLAAAAARSILVDRLGMAADVIPSNDFAPERYQAPDGGLSLLPYASSDLELSTLAALVDPARFDESRLAGYLLAVVADPAETRERRIIALAGLAAMGEPVLPELRGAADDPELTIRERLYVGIGAAQIGDATTARAIADDLLAAYGDQSAGQIRLRVGENAVDSTSATALAAVLAASIGDRRAPLLWASAEANPPTETVQGLQGVAYAAATLDWLDSEPARFAWTVGGTRTVVDLEPGAGHSLTVTSAQLANLRIERLDGAIGVTTSWREPMNGADFTPDPDVSVRRTVTPAERIGSGDVIRVDIAVTFGPQARRGCHQVTDHVPSGLVPVGNLAAWLDPDANPMPRDASLPYGRGGQLVQWCAEPTPEARTVVLRYFARVITPGSYVWQPTVVSADGATDLATVTAETRIEIR